MNCRVLILSIAVLTAFNGFPQAPQSGVRKFNVSGRAVNAQTGEALRNASVQLVPTTDRARPLNADVGPDGSFEFHGIEPGKYSLVGQAPNFPRQAFEEHENFNTAIVVGPDKTSTGIIFRLRPEGSISGRILDEHNEPLRDAQVMLFERSTDTGKRLIEHRRQLNSDDQGEYHFNHLRPGMYYVVVAAQPWYRRYLQVNMRRRDPSGPAADLDPALDVAYPITYYPGATDADNAGALIVHPGDRLSADFALAPVPSLHLTIVNNAGDEAARVMMPNLRARVFGDADASVFSQTMTSGRQNEIELSGIAPGDYSLSVTRRDGSETRMSSQEISLSGDIQVDPSSVPHVEGVHGRIKYSGASPPSNASLQFQDTNAQGGMGTRPDEHGEFKLQPPHAGRFVVSLANAPGYAIRTISATGARVSGRTLELTGVEPVELTIEASEGVGQIDGTVMNGDKPVSGTMVVLAPQDIADNASLFRRDQSDSDGTFTLRDVVPGRYTAVAIENGWELEWGSPEALRPYLVKGTPVVVNGKDKLEIKVAAQ